MTKNLISKSKALSNYGPVFFFVLGFLFDVFTLSRIDQTLTIFQQAFFQLTLIVLLSLSLKYRDSLPPWKSFFLKLWKHKDSLIHFLFGSLLSAYSIFYFKSASFFVSFDFLLILFALLIVNEHPKFKSLGINFKFALFSLCLVSYFSYLTPIVFKSVGVVPFLTGILLCLVIYFLLIKILKRLNIPDIDIKQAVAIPSSIVLLVFLLLYFTKILPPVPISAKYLGIYHGITSEDSKYKLAHEKSSWKFWQNGDQLFYAEPGDKVYCFVSIFSPTAFKDQVVFHWLYNDPKHGWLSQDRISIAVKGGRDRGFRAYTNKTQYQPGKWRVQVETTDGREISRIYFTVVSRESSGQDRVFDYDYY